MIGLYALKRGEDLRDERHCCKFTSGRRYVWKIHLDEEMKQSSEWQSKPDQVAIEANS